MINSSDYPLNTSDNKNVVENKSVVNSSEYPLNTSDNKSMVENKSVVNSSEYPLTQAMITERATAVRGYIGIKL